MATNQYLPFATGGGANVLAPAAYASLAARTAGFAAGTALSVQLNTVWRQASVVAAMLGQFIGDYGGFDANDDGNVTALELSFARTLQKASWNYGVDTGSATALAVTLPSAPAAYSVPLQIWVKVANTATGAATINVNGLGPKPIVWSDQSAISPSDWSANAVLSLSYDGTSFQLTGISPAAVQSGRWTYAMAGGSATALTATMAPVPAALTVGMEFTIQTTSAAAGPSTLNVNGLGAKPITDANAAAITPGFWQAGNFLVVKYDGTNFRVLSGARSITLPFSVTNAATQGLANNTLAQVNFATAGGSTSFGSYTSSNFTFSRAGSYFVSGSVTTSVTISGASNIASSVQLRQNGGAVPGASSGDGNYAPGATTTGATQYYGGIVNVAAGDVLSLFASSGASANYSSSNVSNVLFAITLIN